MCERGLSDWLMTHRQLLYEHCKKLSHEILHIGIKSTSCNRWLFTSKEDLNTFVQVMKQKVKVWQPKQRQRWQSDKWSTTQAMVNYNMQFLFCWCCFTILKRTHSNNLTKSNSYLKDKQTKSRSGTADHSLTLSEHKGRKDQPSWISTYKYKPDISACEQLPTHSLQDSTVGCVLWEPACFGRAHYRKLTRGHRRPRLKPNPRLRVKVKEVLKGRHTPTTVPLFITPKSI